MAYAAVASLLQTLDSLTKSLSLAFKRKKNALGLTLTRFSSVLDYLERKKEHAHLLKEIQVLVQMASKDLNALEAPLTVEDYETDLSLNVSKCKPHIGQVLRNIYLDPSSQSLPLRVRVCIRELSQDSNLLFRSTEISITSLYQDIWLLLNYLDGSSDISEPLLKCIKEVCDRAKDAIEEYMVQSQFDATFIWSTDVKIFQSWRGGSSEQEIHELENMIASIMNIVYGSEMAGSWQEIKSIKMGITREDRHLNDMIGSLKSPNTSQMEPKEETLVAFEDEQLILEGLTNDRPQGLEMVSIVGMGGIGKTTLAKQLFNHPYAIFHFDCRAWITISQVYNVRDLLLCLLDSFGQRSDKIIEKSKAELAEDVYRCLKGRKYLIVMDDLWNIDVWNDIKRCLPDNKTGSRIIVTSRFTDLANHVSPHKVPHFMKLLNTQKSWELLRKLICGNNAIWPSEFEDVGKQIAKRCDGLPLAIVVVAGVLSRTPKTLDSWAHIAENLNSIVARDSEQCLDILGLSYRYLPLRLRARFLYMGAFPEDCEIEVQKLIHLWVAEGFLHSESSENLEDIAENSLEELIRRNLVMIEKRDFVGKVKTCRLHDFVREFCLREARKENFMNVVRRNSGENFPGGLRNQRRLSFHLDPYCDVPAAPTLPKVSSFLCFSLGLDIVADILFIQLGFKLLRVLDIYFLRFEYFPEQLLRLIHLRYLALNVTFKLPATMCQLRNLQTFVIQGPCPTFLLMYWWMPSLRHLRSRVPIELKDPVGQQLLARNYWQTLSVIRLSSCRSKVFTVMPNLKRLQICETKDDYSKDRSCRLLKNRVYLKKLETLKCCFYSQNGDARRISCLDAFPSTVRHLSLSWCYLAWEDMTTIARLPNLEVLKLKNHAFLGPKWMVTEEGFCSLKCLLIDNTDLVHWEATVHQFPRLQKLTLKLCKHLEEIPFGIDSIGSLHRLEVHYCSDPMEVLAKDFQEQVEGVDVVIKRDLSSTTLKRKRLVV